MVIYKQKQQLAGWTSSVHKHYYCKYCAMMAGCTGSGCSASNKRQPGKKFPNTLLILIFRATFGLKKISPYALHFRF